MTPRNYMVVDARRDHGMKIPRPDLTAVTGAPNACTGCHAAKSAAWAAAAAAGWYGAPDTVPIAGCGGDRRRLVTYVGRR